MTRPLIDTAIATDTAIAADTDARRRALVRVTRHYRFCAAHRLHTDALSDDDNRTVFGKCNNPNGHGHNYTVCVTVAGAPHPDTGDVADMEALDRLVHRKIVARFDHRHLNHDPAFLRLVTTGENLVRFIWDELAPDVPTLDTIGLRETRDNYFEYRADTSRMTATPTHATPMSVR